MLDNISNHIIPDDQISFGAGGDGKSISKAGDDGCADDVKCLTWGGIGGSEGFYFFPEVACHTLDLVFPVKVHGEFNSKVNKRSV